MDGWIDGWMWFLLLAITVWKHSKRCLVGNPGPKMNTVYGWMYFVYYRAMHRRFVHLDQYWIVHTILVHYSEGRYLIGIQLYNCQWFDIWSFQLSQQPKTSYRAWLILSLRRGKLTICTGKDEQIMHEYYFDYFNIGVYLVMFINNYWSKDGLHNTVNPF